MRRTMLRQAGPELSRSAPCEGTTSSSPTTRPPGSEGEGGGGHPPALGDSLPGSLTRVTGVVRAGVRTGRRPGTRESQVPGNRGYGCLPRPRHACSSAGRVGVIVFIGFLSGPVGASAQRGRSARLLPGRSGQVVQCPALVARQMLLQVAARDIAPLTEIEPSDAC